MNHKNADLQKLYEHRACMYKHCSLGIAWFLIKEITFASIVEKRTQVQQKVMSYNELLFSQEL